MKKVNKIFMFLGVSLFLAANSIFVNASEQVFYSDNYAEALHEIKNHSDFKITIGAEYYFIVEDKETGEKYQRNIRSDRSKEFEQYCKDDLNIDLNSMLPKNVVQVKYDDKEKTRDVISDKGVTGSGKISQNLDSLQSEDVYASSDTQNKKLYASNNSQNDLQNNPYQVTFNVNGGVGNDVTTDAICSYKLPSFTGVSFKPSAGKEFIGWSRSASGPVITGENIIVNGSTMLYAIWDYTCRNETGVYVLTGESDCPKNANCVECPALKKWKFESCQTGYVDDGNGTCRPLDQGCTTGVLNEYPLTSCPDGAICADTSCSGRYKIDHCQDDYELQDGTCKCHKELRMTGTLDGSYVCDMCHQEWGSDGVAGGNMCILEVGMENMCDEYEGLNGSGVEYRCVSKYPGQSRRGFWLDRNEADSYGIADIDRYSNKKGSISHNSRGDRVYYYYGYRDGVDSEYIYYDNSLYLTKEGCEYIGKTYFSTAGKEIDLLKGYSDKACKQDCTGFTGDFCPEDKKCLVCGNGEDKKYKIVGDHYENKGWKCYKISEGMEESDECNCEEYKNKSKDGSMLTSEEPGCSVDTYMCQSETTGEKFYSGVCGACGVGYEMKEPGKCEYIPCGADFWMEAPMNLSCSDDEIKYGTCDNDDIRPTKEYVPMNGCTQEGKQVCEKHYGSDAYVGNQKWLTGYNLGQGDERDGCYWDYYHTYFKCTECEAGYTLKNGACVADSGVGSIYYYEGDENKPIGIVFEETEEAIKVVSLENLGGLTYDYSYGPTPRGTSYYWEDAMSEAGKYAPAVCKMGSFCGKGNWRLPTLEEMLDISENFDDGGPLVQAIRGLENSCSQENSMRLPSHRYWTSTSVVQHTNAESVYGGADINAAYVVYHPIYNNRDYKEASGKKNSIAPYMRSARPVLTIRRNRISEPGNTTQNGGTGSRVRLPDVTKSNGSGSDISTLGECITELAGARGMYAYGYPGCALTGVYKPYSGVDAINVCLKCKSGYCYSGTTRLCEKE